jgi:hypothetical protein
VLKRHITRINDYLWIAEDGMKTKVLYSLTQTIYTFMHFPLIFSQLNFMHSFDFQLSLSLCMGRRARASERMLYVLTRMNAESDLVV